MIFQKKMQIRIENDGSWLRSENDWNTASLQSAPSRNHTIHPDFTELLCGCITRGTPFLHDPLGHDSKTAFYPNMYNRKKTRWSACTGSSGKCLKSCIWPLWRGVRQNQTTSLKTMTCPRRWEGEFCLRSIHCRVHQKIVTFNGHRFYFYVVESNRRGNNRK